MRVMVVTLQDLFLKSPTSAIIAAISQIKFLKVDFPRLTNFLKQTSVLG